MTIKTLGIDIAKNIFHLIGMSAKGHIVLKKQLSRKKLESFIATLPVCAIGMEACGGSSYWARRFKSYGHEVKLISPQYVKPYVKSNKNDFQDAEAICEAMTRPTMRFVSIKHPEQQDIQALHRIRQRVMEERTALVNQIRGLLYEYGIVIHQGIGYVRRTLPLLINDEEQELSPLARMFLRDMYEELCSLDERVKRWDKAIEALADGSPVCQRLQKIKGVGPLTATALVAAVGDGKEFKNGRHMAAWLGLVPRQNSSGGKTVLLGISKRGNCYLRSLIVHGARSAAQTLSRQSDWFKALLLRSGPHKACVALANKNARMLWALLVKEQDYHPAF